jgi:hypothetical protein
MLSYDDPLGMGPHQLPAEESKPSLSQVIREVGQVLQGYWGVFGWGLILVDPIVYFLIAGFVLVGLLGWLRRSGAGLRSELLNRLSPASITTERRIVVLLALGVLVNLVGLVLWLSRTSVPYGSRLLFPTVGPLAVLLVAGWRRWLGSKRARSFAWAIALILGCYAGIVPWRYLRPVYASPVVPLSAVAQATPLDVKFDVGDPGTTAAAGASGIRLLGYELAPEDARPGDRVMLTLYWQAATPVRDDLTVFVQLAPQDPQQRIAGLDDYLGTSRYPTSVWRQDEVIRQVHQLQLGQDTPAPVLYWFSVGVYSDPSGGRLPASLDNVQLPDRAVRLGPLRVLSQDPWEPGQRVDYRFGSAIHLTGYDLQVSKGSGTSAGERSSPDYSASINVTLYWQADATLEQDWIVFVHLLDADGHLVTQHDSSPRQGDYPTWTWRSGDRVPDAHTLFLSSDLSPGTYRLHIGMYRPVDGVRMPIFDSTDWPVPDSVLSLTEVDLFLE